MKENEMDRHAACIEAIRFLINLFGKPEGKKPLG